MKPGLLGHLRHHFVIGHVRSPYIRFPTPPRRGNEFAAGRGLTQARFADPRRRAMADVADFVFLFDVDNTLIDNDQVQQDLSDHLNAEYGADVRDRYWAIVRADPLRARLCRLSRRARTLPARGPARSPHPAYGELAGRLSLLQPALSRRARGGRPCPPLGRSGHPVRRRRGVPAAQGRALGPVARVRGARADLHPQGGGARRRRALVSGPSLRADRRQAAHPHRRQAAPGATR